MGIEALPDTDDSVELYEKLVEDDRSDGLPIVQPTADRVNEAIAHSHREPDDLILRIPANFSELTVQKLAQCAVMAGCRPEYFPVVETAFEAMAEWDNLQAVTSTTGGFWVAAIANGSVIQDLNINTGTGLFGPGYRANATIGRAITLAFITVGGVYPGTGTMATQGHQGRYTYFFGENGTDSPWSPLHQDLGGLDDDESAVTMVTAHAPMLVAEGNQFGSSVTQEDVLKAFSRCGAYRGAAAAAKSGEVVFVMSEDHATRLGRKYTKAEVKEYLFEHCRLAYTETPLMRSPDDAIIVVAGGASNMSSVIHTFTYSENEAVTKPIRGDWSR